MVGPSPIAKKEQKAQNNEAKGFITAHTDFDYYRRSLLLYQGICFF